MWLCSTHGDRAIYGLHNLRSSGDRTIQWSHLHPPFASFEIFLYQLNCTLTLSICSSLSTVEMGKGDIIFAMITTADRPYIPSCSLASMAAVSLHEAIRLMILSVILARGLLLRYGRQVSRHVTSPSILASIMLSNDCANRHLETGVRYHTIIILTLLLSTDAAKTQWVHACTEAMHAILFL